MRQQTKPFIVQIKQSRKLKPAIRKPSIRGRLDLNAAEDHAVCTKEIEPAIAERGDRP
ncbi:MAG: hypothetical protein O9256_04160 [Rhizobiaceae bacterium]|nr:hypothetical protein [Rhizobiaceae bacterium]MCZ8351851.1 hypothetical protein [Rhizobium sp.]